MSIPIHCAYTDLMNIKEIKLNPRNTNKHPKDQIDRFIKILKYQGVRSPIVISNLSKIVIAGEGRYIAMKKAGLKQVPVDIQHFENYEQERLHLTADNALSEWAEINLAMVNEDAIEMGPDIDIDLFGLQDFTIDPIDKYEDETEDETPEPPKDTISKTGDIYELGGHRLLCGDATKEDDVNNLMNGAKADMVFTDPPYGMDLDAEGFDKMPTAKGTSHHSYKNVIGDTTEYDPLFILAYFADCKEIFLWGFDYYAYRLPRGTPIVWDKRKEGGMDKMFGSAFELCWSKEKHKREIARIIWAGYFGMGGEDTKTRIHPTQKPVKLCDWFLDKYSKSDHTIVDIYGGSGSTLIACEKTNRKCFMMEIDPTYIDVIVTRWCNYTGEYKIKLNGKQTTWMVDGKKEKET